MCTGLILGNVAGSFGCRVIKFRRHVFRSLKSNLKEGFTMCETFEWIKFLAVELPKNGLQIRVKISLGK